MEEKEKSLCQTCKHFLGVKFANGAEQKRCLLGISLYGAENVVECSQYEERKDGKVKVSSHASRGRSDMGKVAEGK